MPTVLVVEKTGVIKETIMKTFSEKELYKKAGFKTNDGFECQHKWAIEIDNEKTVVSLFAKTNGRAGQENKYDFPPPVDTVLFFGACVLVSNISEDASSCGNLNVNMWEAIYETLFGGFEDIDKDSDVSEDNVSSVVPRTKEGYVKDGFIVDDDDDSEFDDDDDDDDDDQDEDEELEIQLPKKNIKKPVAKNKKITVFDKIDTMVTPQDLEILQCTKELEEELYDE
jgi:hypothetical protein